MLFSTSDLYNIGNGKRESIVCFFLFFSFFSNFFCPSLEMITSFETNSLENKVQIYCSDLTVSLLRVVWNDN